MRGLFHLLYCRLKVGRDYSTLVDEDSLDYVGNTEYKARKQYCFAHTLSHIMMSLRKNGFAITSFEEYKDDISGVYKEAEKNKVKVPLSYILVADKPGKMC